MPYGHCIVYDDFVAEEDIATFVFRYRSKSALQAEGIIPRTPSPTPLEERPLEELNQEELRELLRRHRASPPFVDSTLFSHSFCEAHYLTRSTTGT